MQTIHETTRGIWTAEQSNGIVTVTYTSRDCSTFARWAGAVAGRRLHWQEGNHYKLPKIVEREAFRGGL